MLSRDHANGLNETLVNGSAQNGGTAVNGAAINGTAANGSLVKMGKFINGSAANARALQGWQQRSADGDEFIEEIMPRLLKKILDSYKNTDSRVIEFLQPEELGKRIDFGLGDEPIDNERLEEELERAIKYSVKTGHPYFFNQLFNGVDTIALSGAILNEALNTSCYTYEVAPVGTLMEREIIQKIVKEYIGFSQGDGIFCPGGSAANMYSLSLARFLKYPESKIKGMREVPPIHIYTSDLSHYSLTKASFFLGFGLESIVKVETDNVGRMIPEKLDEAISNSKSQGFVPLMVNATAGVTVFGAYDPIDKIAEVCKKHSVGSTGHIWIHVDGAWGGSVLLSPNLRHKMKGIEQVDSLTWDPHKMTGSILQCAVFITRHPELLSEAHSAKARYLFQQDKVYDCSYDTGDKSIQCGRKVDSLKLWVQWKAYGSVGMAGRVESCFENALYLRDKIRSTPGFRLLVDEPECTNICFWYIPSSMRGEKENVEWWDRLSKVAPAIKAQMQLKGSMLIGYQPQGEFVNFFRMVVANANSTKQDMDHVVNIISSYGESLSQIA